MKAQLNRLDRLEAKLDAALELLQLLLNQGEKTMSTIADLTAAVAAEQTVITSAVALINGLVQELAAAQATGNQAAFDAAVASIQSQTAALSAAVANVPASATPPPATPAPVTPAPVTPAPASPTS